MNCPDVGVDGADGDEGSTDGGEADHSDAEEVEQLVSGDDELRVIAGHGDGNVDRDQMQSFGADGVAGPAERDEVTGSSGVDGATGEMNDDIIEGDHMQSIGLVAARWRRERHNRRRPNVLSLYWRGGQPD